MIKPCALMLVLASMVGAGGCDSTPGLAAGMTIQECRRQFTHALLHEFTTERDGVVIACYAPQNLDEFEPRYLVFRDDALSHVSTVPPFGRKVNYLDGRRVSEWRAQTDALDRLASVAAAEPVDVAFRRREHRNTADESGGSVQPLFFLMLPLLPLQAAQVSLEAAVEKGTSAAYRFDARLLRPGANRQEVHAALGVPQKVISCADQRTIEIYGRVPRRDDPALPPFQCVAISYRQNVIEHVLSNDFIDELWMD